MSVKVGEAEKWASSHHPEHLRLNHPSTQQAQSSLGPWMDGEVSLVYVNPRQGSIPSTLLPSQLGSEQPDCHPTESHTLG